MNEPAEQPLSGIRVLDLSTLLPGPLAGLILAEAGAHVIKVERPQGEDARAFPPYWQGQSAFFALLNAGKSSVSLDLKAQPGVGALQALIADADVLIEQFRPGVMDRLGLGPQSCHAINPRLIYCSITGYGAAGPKADVAGHDLNYIGDTGLLSLSRGSIESPVIPPALVADIAGGTLPAVINILLALIARNRTGQGSRIDVAMCDAMFMFSFWAQASGQIGGLWPSSGDSLLTGGSPRYQLYRTADDRLLAVAALEQPFWTVFCDSIGLEEQFCNDFATPTDTGRAIAAIIRSRPAGHWRTIFAAKDCCCSVVASLEEAWQDPHFRQRGLFDYRITTPGGGTIPALCVPISPQFRKPASELRSAEPLGTSNDLLLPASSTGTP